jgi:hypothetical protein
MNVAIEISRNDILTLGRRTQEGNQRIHDALSTQKKQCGCEFITISIAILETTKDMKEESIDAMVAFIVIHFLLEDAVGEVAYINATNTHGQVRDR